MNTFRKHSFSPLVLFRTVLYSTLWRHVAISFHFSCFTNFSYELNNDLEQSMLFCRNDNKKLYGKWSMESKNDLATTLHLYLIFEVPRFMPLWECTVAENLQNPQQTQISKRHKHLVIVYISPPPSPDATHNYIFSISFDLTNWLKPRLKKYHCDHSHREFSKLFPVHNSGNFSKEATFLRNIFLYVALVPWITTANVFISEYISEYMALWASGHDFTRQRDGTVFKRVRTTTVIIQ